MKRLINIFLILALSSVFVSSAEAWTILRLSDPNGDVQLAGWDRFSRNNQLSFDINDANCDITRAELNAAIDLAFDVWNKIPYSAIRLVRGNDTTATAGSDPPSIFCDNNATLGIDTDGTAGIGGPTSVNTGTGEILEGRLVLNSNPAHGSRMSNLSAQLRAVVIAHEVGHVMGFGHSSDTSSLMYFNASAKETLNLSQDDIDAIMFMYPRDEFGPDSFLGCSSVDAGSGGGSSPLSGPVGLNFMGLLLLMGLIWASVRKISSPKNA